MPDINAKVPVNASGSQIVFTNKGVTPTIPSAAQPVMATAKSVGQTNAVVHGQVLTGGTVFGPIVDNPA